MKTLLLTGSTGFIGTKLLGQITHELGGHYKMVLLSSSSNDQLTTILHKDYTFNKKDFYNQGIESIDTVFHLGAFTPKSGAEANNLKLANSNINNTKHLLDNLPNQPKQFIFASTLDVYGKVTSIVNESTTTAPVTMYGWSKLYCEKMLERWAAENNVLLQVLRIGHIYGAGEEAYKKIIPITIQKLKNNDKPQIFGKGLEKRSFLHVDDLCRLIIKSLSLETYAEPINLCSAKSYSIKEVIALLLKASKKDLAIAYVDTNNNPIDLVFDVSKMEKLLGDETVSFQQGLEQEYYNFNIAACAEQ